MEGISIALVFDLVTKLLCPGVAIFAVCFSIAYLLGEVGDRG